MLLELWCDTCQDRAFVSLVPVCPKSPLLPLKEVTSYMLLLRERGCSCALWGPSFISVFLMYFLQALLVTTQAEVQVAIVLRNTLEICVGPRQTRCVLS